MLKDYLLKLKLKTTLYDDYDDGYWSRLSPKLFNPYYRLGEDYDLLRKGTILYAYENKDANTEKDEFGGSLVLLFDNNGLLKMRYDNMDDLFISDCYDVLEDTRGS